MKKAMKWLTLLAAMLVLAGFAAGCGKEEAPAPAEPAQPAATEPAAEAPAEALPEQVQAIVDRGVLRVGVKEDVPGFGMRNTATGEIEGMEVDVAKLIAKEILGDENAIELTPVTAKTRGPLLDNGDIDMILATFTITPERRETYNFSTPYYTDAVGLLVKTDSAYNSLADMDGALVGVAQSATAKDAILAAAEEAGITVNIDEYATYPEIKAALDSGRVNVFSVDRSISRGYIDDTTKLLDDAFNPQDYGVATKLDNTELAAYVDGLIAGWLEDGTIQGFVDQWEL